MKKSNLIFYSISILILFQLNFVSLNGQNIGEFHSGIYNATGSIILNGTVTTSNISEVEYFDLYLSNETVESLPSDLFMINWELRNSSHALLVTEVNKTGFSFEPKEQGNESLFNLMINVTANIPNFDFILNITYSETVHFTTSIPLDQTSDSEDSDDDYPWYYLHSILKDYQDLSSILKILLFTLSEVVYWSIISYTWNLQKYNRGLRDEITKLSFRKFVIELPIKLIFTVMILSSSYVSFGSVYLKLYDDFQWNELILVLNYTLLSIPILLLLRSFFNKHGYVTEKIHNRISNIMDALLGHVILGNILILGHSIDESIRQHESGFIEILNLFGILFILGFTFWEFYSIENENLNNSRRLRIIGAALSSLSFLSIGLVFLFDKINYQMEIPLILLLISYFGLYGLLVSMITLFVFRELFEYLLIWKKAKYKNYISHTISGDSLSWVSISLILAILALQSFDTYIQSFSNVIYQNLEVEIWDFLQTGIWVSIGVFLIVLANDARMIFLVQSNLIPKLRFKFLSTFIAVIVTIVLYSYGYDLGSIIPSRDILDMIISIYLVLILIFIISLNYFHIESYSRLGKITLILSYLIASWTGPILVTIIYGYLGDHRSSVYLFVPVVLSFSYLNWKLFRDGAREFNIFDLVERIKIDELDERENLKNYIIVKTGILLSNDFTLNEITSLFLNKKKVWKDGMDQSSITIGAIHEKIKKEDLDLFDSFKEFTLNLVKTNLNIDILQKILEHFTLAIEEYLSRNYHASAVLISPNYEDLVKNLAISHLNEGVQNWIDKKNKRNKSNKTITTDDLTVWDYHIILQGLDYGDDQIVIKSKMNEINEYRNAITHSRKYDQGEFKKNLLDMLLILNIIIPKLLS